MSCTNDFQKPAYWGEGKLIGVWWRYLKESTFVKCNLSCLEHDSPPWGIHPSQITCDLIQMLPTILPSRLRCWWHVMPLTVARYIALPFKLGTDNPIYILFKFLLYKSIKNTIIIYWTCKKTTSSFPFLRIVWHHHHSFYFLQYSACVNCILFLYGRCQFLCIYPPPLFFFFLYIDFSETINIT